MAREDEVRQASDRFYAALNRMITGQTDTMRDAWSHGADVTAMHPIGGRQVGWEQVRESFDQVAGMASSGEVHLEDQLITVEGDLAYELGIERGRATLADEQIKFDHRVTNIYRRERGQWRMVHHHTDLNAGMVDLLNRLQAEHMMAG